MSSFSPTSNYLCKKLPLFSWPPVALDTRLLRRKDTLRCGSGPAWFESRRRTTVGDRRAGGTRTVYALVSSSPRSRRSGKAGAVDEPPLERPEEDSPWREGEAATGSGRKLWQLLWRRWGWAVQDTFTSERADVVEARRGNPRRLHLSWKLPVSSAWDIESLGKQAQRLARKRSDKQAKLKNTRNKLERQARCGSSCCLKRRTSPLRQKSLKFMWLKLNILHFRIASSLENDYKSRPVCTCTCFDMPDFYLLKDPLMCWVARLASHTRDNCLWRQAVYFQPTGAKIDGVSEFRHKKKEKNVYKSQVTIIIACCKQACTEIAL